MPSVPRKLTDFRGIKLCSMCGEKGYGQEQPEARAEDLKKLTRVREAREAKANRQEKD